MELSELLMSWRAGVEAQIPGLEIFDAHSHVGQNDPDGFTQTFEELVQRLDVARARGCFVFPFHEPDGYPGPNDAVREEALTFAAAHPDGPLTVPFCRVDPHTDAVSEAERSLALGARGIKLHPRAEAFTLDHPVVRDIFAVAHEHRVPVLIHSGRGIEAPGVHILRLAEAFPGARVILAHAGATDLSWLWRTVVDVPNVVFDSAWFNPADMVALFSLIPPAQIVFASDAPYGDTLVTAVTQARLMLSVGLSPEQIRLIFAEQSLHLARGEALAVAGGAVGEREQAPHVLLDRVAEYILLAMMLWVRGGDGSEALALARQACNVPDEHDDAPIFAQIAQLLTLHDQLLAAAPESRARLSVLIMAGCLARTPDVPLPVV